MCPPIREGALNRPKKPSGRHAARLHRDGITARLSCSFNFLATRDAKKQGAVLGYGQFLTVAINFLIVAFVLFMAIRGINKLKKKEEEKPAAIPAEVKLLGEIRDLLARRSA